MKELEEALETPTEEAAALGLPVRAGHTTMRRMRGVWPFLGPAFVSRDESGSLEHVLAELYVGCFERLRSDEVPPSSGLVAIAAVERGHRQPRMCRDDHRIWQTLLKLAWCVQA